MANAKRLRLIGIIMIVIAFALAEYGAYWQTVQQTKEFETKIAHVEEVNAQIIRELLENRSRIEINRVAIETNQMSILKLNKK